MKKVIAIVLSCIMVLSMCAACGQKTEDITVEAPAAETEQVESTANDQESPELAAADVAVEPEELLNGTDSPEEVSYKQNSK